MNNSAAKVGEIFTEAGAAFNKLAEMTMLLHPIAENIPSAHAKVSVKKKTDEKVSTTVMNQSPHNIHSGSMSQQVTLNMLNAQESEIDNDGITNQVKLEFESSTEEVNT